MNKHKNVYKEIEKMKRKITRLPIYPFQTVKRHRKERRRRKWKENEKKKENY